MNMFAAVPVSPATGQDIVKPNLFIIGSMKSGTTYLARLLASHPSVVMSRVKEPCYFVTPSQLRILWPYTWKQGYWRSEETYLNLFRSPKRATILAEASVYYTHLPLASGVSERMRQFNPDARLIYLMRDPVERTISHYWHRVKSYGESRSPLKAIKNDPQYCDVSHYAMQLRPYLALFKRDQLKILTFEELVSDTTQAIVSIFSWLNLDSSLATVSHQPENVTAKTIEQSRWNLPRRLIRKTPFLRTAVDFVPDSVRRSQIFKRKVNRMNVDTSEVVSFLRPRQQIETEDLTQLLGREFPEWTTLNNTVTSRD